MDGVTIATLPVARGAERHRNPRGEGGRLRDEIVGAAAAMLDESGDPRLLTLRGVARSVGIAAPSVYLHFPDVEHLAAAVVERRFAALTAAADAAERGIADPAQALLARCRAYCRFGMERPGLYRVMFQAELPAPLADLGERTPGRVAFAAMVRAVERCIQAGVARPHDDPFRLASLVWAAMHGLVSARISRPQFPWAPLDALVDEAVAHLVGLDVCERDASGPT